MANALIWMLGISATVLMLAYLAIFVAMLAAKRRMAAPKTSRTVARSNVTMRYRTP